MFNPHAEPIRNDAVYRRISINDPAPAEPPRGLTTWEICDALMKQHEANRIWQEVVSTASGTNAPYVAPSEDCA